MSDETELKKVKIALQTTDTKFDDLLNLYLEDATSFLKLRLSLKDSDELPNMMKAIVREVAVKKFNRLKNEGMSSYSQDGESITFNANDFDEWQDEIDQWLKDNHSVNVGLWCNPYEV